METEALIEITRGSDSSYFYVDIRRADNSFLARSRRFDSLVQASGWSVKQCADCGFEKIEIILDIEETDD